MPPALRIRYGYQTTPQSEAPASNASVGSETGDFKEADRILSQRILPSPMNPSAVLHVVSPLGGGVDRHVRDVVAAVARPQVLWHVGERAEVVEGADPGRRYLPLDPARIDAAPQDFARWMKGLGIGLVHLHTVVKPLRGRPASTARFRPRHPGDSGHALSLASPARAPQTDRLRMEAVRHPTCFEDLPPDVD